MTLQLLHSEYEENLICFFISEQPLYSRKLRQEFGLRITFSSENFKCSHKFL
jgi:hypothetical protein